VTGAANTAEAVKIAVRKSLFVFIPISSFREK
jgi:hypothetical protein